MLFNVQKENAGWVKSCSNSLMSQPPPEFLSSLTFAKKFCPVLDLLRAHRASPLSLIGLDGSICSLSGLFICPLHLPPAFTPVRPQIRSPVERVDLTYSSGFLCFQICFNTFSKLIRTACRTASARQSAKFRDNVINIHPFD